MSEFNYSSHLSLPSIKRHIERLMKHYAINFQELQARTKIPAASLRKILEGQTENPHLSTLLLLANGLGVSVGTLIGHNDENVSCPKQAAKAATAVSGRIPILPWNQVTQWINAPFDKAMEPYFDGYLFVDQNISPLSFALKSVPVLYPTFPKGSILVVDPERAECDGDYVIVLIGQREKSTPVLRQLTIEGGYVHYQRPHGGEEVVKQKPSYLVLGTVCETRIFH